MTAAPLLYSLAILGLATPASAAIGLASDGVAADAPLRAPTGRWVVDFDDAQCVASRNYGTDDEPLILALKAPLAGEVMQVAIVRRGRGGRYADQLDAEIGIDGRSHVSTTMLAMMTDGDNRRLYRFNLSLEQFDPVRHARTLSIRGGNEFAEVFQLSEMAPLLRVMDECVADLRAVWNAAGAQEAPSELARRARGSLQGLIRGEDYPGVAIREGAGGSVRFVLLIDENGRVADCTVTQTSGVAALDAQSCAVITQRARFEPAIGPDGRPAKDVVYQTVTWRLEG